MANDRGTISLLDCTTPALEIALQDYALSPNLQQAILGASGAVDPTFAGILSAAPSLAFATRAISTALTAAGIAGAEATTLEFFLQKIAAYGTRAGATSHTKVTIGKAFLVPRSLNCSVGGLASLAYEAIALSTDGTTAPVTLGADTASITAGGTATESFAMGPVSINGTALEVSDVAVDFGLDVRVEGHDDPYIYPVLAYVMNRAPSITLTTPDRLAVKTFGLTGAAQGATASTIMLRKMLAGGTRSVSADNITITIEAGHIAVNTVGGSHGDRLSTAITITPIYDGTNAIMVIACNAAA